MFNGTAPRPVSHEAYLDSVDIEGGLVGLMVEFELDRIAGFAQMAGGRFEKVRRFGAVRAGGGPPGFRLAGRNLSFRCGRPAGRSLPHIRIFQIHPGRR